MACPTHVQPVSGTGPSGAQGLRTQFFAEPRDQGPGSGVLPRSSEPPIFLVRWGRAAPESVWKGQGDGPTGGIGCNRDRLRGRDGVCKEAQGVSDLQALRSQEIGDRERSSGRTAEAPLSDLCCKGRLMTVSACVCGDIL